MKPNVKYIVEWRNGSLTGYLCARAHKFELLQPCSRFGMAEIRTDVLHKYKVLLLVAK